MALTKKQSELDVSKWLKSEQAGRDLCGEFDFCVKCDKENENPCAKALTAYGKSDKSSASAAKKTAKPAKTAAPAEKKTAAKKKA